MTTVMTLTAMIGNGITADLADAVKIAKIGANATEVVTVITITAITEKDAASVSLDVGNKKVVFNDYRYINHLISISS